MPTETARRKLAIVAREPLPENLFRSVVAHAPLVAIDLVVQDRQRRVLLGWRRNPPARGYWFVPGDVCARTRRWQRPLLASAPLS